MKEHIIEIKSNDIFHLCVKNFLKTIKQQQKKNYYFYKCVCIISERTDKKNRSFYPREVRDYD